jgi:hypothetical protein
VINLLTASKLLTSTLITQRTSSNATNANNHLAIGSLLSGPSAPFWYASIPLEMGSLCNGRDNRISLWEELYLELGRGRKSQQL